jgi:RNA polymerase sigma-70 factor (ECF subfamily)
LVETWQRLIYNTSISIVQDSADAEDITQEVFIQVFHSISTFKGDSKISTWLYRIAVTKSLDLLRSRKRKKRFAFVQKIFGADEGSVQPATFVHPGVLLENKERSAVLFNALDKLADNQKAAFTLHKIEGLSYQEVAEVLQVSVSSVESLMVRAKSNLQKYLRDYYENEK